MKTCDRAMSIAVRRAVWVLAVVAAGAAEARESELLFDGGQTNVWSTARDAARLDKEFAVSDLVQAEEPAALRWRFVPKPGTAFNDIFCRAEWPGVSTPCACASKMKGRPSIWR